MTKLIDFFPMKSVAYHIPYTYYKKMRIEELSVCIYSWEEFQTLVFQILIVNEDMKFITDERIDELVKEYRIRFTKTQMKEYRRLMKGMRSSLLETRPHGTDSLVLGEIWKMCIRQIKVVYGDDVEGNANLTKLFHNLLEDAEKTCSDDLDTKEIVYLRLANALKRSKEQIEHDYRNLCCCRVICDIDDSDEVEEIRIVRLPCSFSMMARVC